MRATLYAVVAVLCASPAVAQSTSPVPGPRTVNAAQVLCTNLPVAVIPTPLLRIAGGHVLDSRTALARGDTVVIHRSSGDGLAVGSRYIARRMPRGEDALDAKYEGFPAPRPTGWITVTAIDELNALAHIDFSCDSVEPGDMLEPLMELSLPTSMGPRLGSDFDERNRILAGVDGRTYFADGDIFSIPRGTDHGVAIGGRYSIWRDFHDGRPLVHVGEGIVAELTAGISKLVLVTTKDGVHTGDVAIPRRTQGPQ